MNLVFMCNLISPQYQKTEDKSKSSKIATEDYTMRVNYKINKTWNEEDDLHLHHIGLDMFLERVPWNQCAPQLHIWTPAAGSVFLEHSQVFGLWNPRPWLLQSHEDDEYDDMTIQDK